MGRLIANTLCLALGVFAYVHALSFPARSQGPAGPHFFPQLVAVLLVLASACSLVLEWVGRKGRQPETPSENRPVRLRKFLFGAGLSLLYLAGMHYLGYYAASSLFVFLMLFLADDSNTYSARVALKNLVVTGVLVGLSFLIFTKLLNTYLPRGVWWS